MKKQSSTAKFFIAFFWLWCVAQANTVNAATPLSLSDVPLLIANSVEPNIMFTLDDSGSMQWEFMPGRTAGPDYSYFMFPRPSTPYGGSTYSNRVPLFSDTNVHNFFYRSPANNAVFYNPDITYKPWLNSDGTSMADANPTAAPYNPTLPGPGTLDLTRQITQYASWRFHASSLNSISTTSSNQTYWPITYFLYNGASTDTEAPRLVFGNYTKVEIKDTDSGSYTSPNGTVRTKAAEVQNFANWFTYYRSRILTARAGVGRAFAQQGTNLRVGFAAINKASTTIDGVGTSGSIVKGLRRFSGTERENFFTNLYEYPLRAAGTPLRNALDDVGRYFQRSDNSGPWGETPGTNNSTDHLSCRQSFHILTTDGYWSNGSPASTSDARANVDNQNGPSIPNPDGGSYQYTPSGPYEDNSSDTLADVAMYYWNRDLRTNLDNNVPTNAADPAFWQHLVNFTVGLGVTGSLDPATDLPGLEAGTTSWPSPNTDQRKIDDLWHAAINSRGEFFSTSDPDSFAEGLSNTLRAIGDRVGAAASVATNSGSLQAGSKLFQGRFNSGDWSGQLLYYAIDSDPLSPTFGNILTNGGGPAGSIRDAGLNIADFNSRTIITFDGTTGVPFRWTAGISPTQQTAIGTEAILNYLRGDDSGEQANAGSFRNRTSKLGDVVNSAPIFVGPPNRRFTDNFFGTGAPENSVPYSNFKTTYKNRKSIVYVGANDGMLHGFDADTGDELIAYVPGKVYSNLSALSQPSYNHKFYVDGTPTERDVFFGNKWHTVLVGGLNNGGRGIYALDITNPLAFNEVDADKLVLWEFTDADDAELGYTYSQPDVVRMNNGQWVAVFGNGYNSTSPDGDAVLFIVDIETGALIRKISTETGIAEDPTGNSRPNGLATVSPVDLDGDSNVDAIYAGDLFGNMWAFDVSSANSGQWAVKYGNSNSPKPLFTACDDTACTNTQPITVRPKVGLHPTSDGVIVYFGTGKYIETSDNIVSDPVIKQSYYGIWDMDAIVSSRSTLLQQTIDIESEFTFTDSDTSASFTVPIRVTSNKEIDWEVNNGWYMDLVQPDGTLMGERQVTSSVLRDGRIIFSTIIPGEDPCEGGGTSWLFELDASSGSRLSSPPFDLNHDGNFDAEDNVTIIIDGVPVSVPVSGIKSPNGLFSAPNVTTGNAGDPDGGGNCIEKKTLNTSSGTPVTITESCGPGSGRLSWRQMR